ncbi:nucleotide pyrophosphohydrolase [Yinghuangia sp. ASG 101]|uniref:nucleotide pyrophosphohydrolase n=1 Tax=Yinghuangia sp. ASG 101 TaxID=2896848 RepID=UPI001E526D39|nr:nucleotide pyrophosphohydrolase [Yinghuangia sp. ASG 101]UGQ09731.1 nucleotide pyrophosphohydrolase [Yinghuangia sp. ASG 101]
MTSPAHTPDVPSGAPAGADVLAELTRAVRDFSAARDWEPFHTPKNIVMALSVEASELVEIFQWLTPEQASAVMADDGIAEHVREEVADVLAYLLGLCDVLGIDPAQALRDKMVKNARKYPLP